MEGALAGFRDLWTGNGIMLVVGDTLAGGARCSALPCPFHGAGTSSYGGDAGSLQRMPMIPPLHVADARQAHPSVVNPVER